MRQQQLHHQALIFSGLAALSLPIWGCSESKSSDAPTAESTPTPPANPWFEEHASQRGLNFTWRSGHDGAFLLPQIIGGGVALIDVEGDGDLDVYFIQGGSIDADRPSDHVNKLFLNDGRGMFSEAPDSAGVNDDGYGMGVATGDYDGDGDTDIYVTNVGPNVLLANDGTGNFTDVTASAGVAHPGWSTAAAFFDADGDLDLDLFLTNYINWSPQTERLCYNTAGGVDFCLPAEYNAPAIDVLYLNQGDGTFVDATESSGISMKPGTGLGALPADFNKDGLIDIAVANDGMPDYLWINQGQGRFVESGMQMGTALDEEGKAKAGMGIDAQDLDGDGDLDLLVGNLTGESDSLFFNQGEYFTDATGSTGLRTATRPYTRFGLGFFDFDLDGSLDLFEANGTVTAVPDAQTSDAYAQPNMLLAGTNHRLIPVHPIGGTQRPLVKTSRGAAFGDLDLDGRIDIVVVNKDASASLLHNTVEPAGNWITLNILNDKGSPALGARLLVPDEETQRIIEVRTAGSYLSANTPAVHLGLGDQTALREVTVIWPDGTKRRLGPLDANQAYTITPTTKPDPTPH